MKQIEKHRILFEKTYGGIITPSVAEALERQTLQLKRILYPSREISRSIEQVRHAFNSVSQTFAEAAMQLQNIFSAVNFVGQWQNIHIITPTSLLSRLGTISRWIKEYLQPLGEKLRLLPFYLAWRALEEGDTETVDYFLAKWCDISKPTEDAYLVLWHVLREGNWQSAENPDVYVKKLFWLHYKKRLFERQLFGDKYYERSKLLSEESTKHGFEMVYLENLPESGGRLLLTSKDDIQDIEDQLLFKWILSYIRNPLDRKAIMEYCYGCAKTLREAYGGDKNQQDAARRRIRKVAKELRPLLIS